MATQVRVVDPIDEMLVALVKHRRAKDPASSENKQSLVAGLIVKAWTKEVGK